MSEAQLQLVYGRADAIISQWYQGVAARVDRLRTRPSSRRSTGPNGAASRARTTSSSPPRPPGGHQGQLLERAGLGRAHPPGGPPQAGAARYMAELRTGSALVSRATPPGSCQSPPATSSPPSELRPSSVPAAVKGYDFNTKLAELTIPCAGKRL